MFCLRVATDVAARSGVILTSNTVRLRRAAGEDVDRRALDPPSTTARRR
jgi:hypothetical protein